MIVGIARRVRGALFQSDYGPLFALIVAIQGTVLISQMIAALIVPPAELGAIRTFESVFAVLVLLAGFGAPALAIREMAVPAEGHARGRALRNLLLLPVAGAIVTMVGAVVITLAGWRFIDGPATALALGMGLLIAVNVVRLAAAVAQGLQIARRVWLLAVSGAALCAAIQVGGALIGTLTGWVGGRLAGEAVLLTSLLLAMRGYLPPLAWRDPIDLPALLAMAGRATTINGAFILRMVADAAPIVLLGLAVGEDSDRAVVGYFGIGTLFVTLGLLPVSVISQQTLPVLAATVSPIEAHALGSRLLMKVGIGSTVVMLLTVAVIMPAAALTSQTFREIGVEIYALMLAVPLKGLSAAVSTIMLADGRYSPSLLINALEFSAILATFIGLYGFAAPLSIAVTSTLAGAVLSLAGMVILQRKSKRRGAAW